MIYKLWSSRKPLLSAPNFYAEDEKIYFDSDTSIFYAGDENNVPVPISTGGTTTDMIRVDGGSATTVFNNYVLRFDFGNNGASL